MKKPKKRKPIKDNYPSTLLPASLPLSSPLPLNLISSIKPSRSYPYLSSYGNKCPLLKTLTFFRSERLLFFEEYEVGFSIVPLSKPLNGFAEWSSCLCSFDLLPMKIGSDSKCIPFWGENRMLPMKFSDDGDLVFSYAFNVYGADLASLWQRRVGLFLCSLLSEEKASPLIGFSIGVNYFFPISPLFMINSNVRLALFFDLPLSFLVDTWLLSYLARESSIQNCVYFDESVDQEALSVTSSSALFKSIYVNYMSWLVLDLFRHNDLFRVCNSCCPSLDFNLSILYAMYFALPLGFGRFLICNFYFCKSFEGKILCIIEDDFYLFDNIVYYCAQVLPIFIFFDEVCDRQISFAYCQSESEANLLVVWLYFIMKYCVCLHRSDAAWEFHKLCVGLDSVSARIVYFSFLAAKSSLDLT